jgi:tRNA G18 (ribose-2'-O)-methylase SpoU
VARDEDGDNRQADRVLSTDELRRSKPGRVDFAAQARNPITVVLDGVRGNYNLGAIFRLCDAFLVESLVICGEPVTLHKRRLVQAAAGTQHWVPAEEAKDAAAVVRAAKAAGHWIAVVELTAESVKPAELQPRFPAVLVLGGEFSGVSHEVLVCADQVRMFSRVYDADIGGRKQWLASNGDVVEVTAGPAGGVAGAQRRWRRGQGHLGADAALARTQE